MNSIFSECTAQSTSAIIVNTLVFECTLKHCKVVLCRTFLLRNIFFKITSSFAVKEEDDETKFFGGKSANQTINLPKTVSNQVETRCWKQKWKT